VNKTTRQMKKETEDKEYIHLSTSTTKNTFTIYGCGKFNEEKKHLSKTEAMLLYVRLHTWLMGDEQKG
jgi:hypothetical protein